MSSWRRRLVVAMGDELGRARGEARLLAERTAVEADVEGRKAEQIIGDAGRKQTQLRGIHEKMVATLEARRAAAVRAGHDAALEAARSAAPAAAGAPWQGWKPESGLERGPAPMLRIGRIAGSESAGSGPGIPSPSPHPPTTAAHRPPATTTAAVLRPPAAAGSHRPATGLGGAAFGLGGEACADASCSLSAALGPASDGARVAVGGGVEAGGALGGGTPAEAGSGAGRAAAPEGAGSIAESGSAAADSVDVALAAADVARTAIDAAGADAALTTSSHRHVAFRDVNVTEGYDISVESVTGVSLPALLPLLDRAHLRIDSDAAHALPGLLARAVGSVPAGLVRLHVYDPEHLGGSLSAFAALGKAGLLSFVGPSGLREALDTLVETVRRINADVLAGEHASLAELAAATGRRPEPWRVLVLLNADLASWPAHDQAQLARLRRTGVAAGVHLVIVGDDTAGPADLPRLTATQYTGLPGAAIALDAPPPSPAITAAAKAIAEKHSAGREPARLVDLLPQRLWASSSATGLHAVIGETPAGDVARLALGDNPPHALVGGPSGSGKTNLLYAWIAGLASGYSPDELALYLLDFKEGVSFARFATGRRDPSWLPHVRLVGVNVNDDREFGLALLRHLKDELRRRAEAAKAHEATKLEELRAADPEGHWPRIVAVVDEFQVLLETRDAVTDEAVQLLEDLARRGRSQGIHLVLASQDIAGIEALWGRPSLVAQFTLRIALPKARRVLAENNHAADTVPRFHAVVNDESGHAVANKIVALPNAGHADAWEPLQRRLWEARPPGNLPPALFDGDHVPELAAHTPSPETALLGQTIDVAARGAELALHRAPGRNLAILGTRSGEAADILAAAALTAARGQRIGVDLCCLEPDAASSAIALAAALETEGADVDWHDDLGSLCKDWELRCDGTLRLNLVYAVDAGSARLDAAQSARLRAMLIDGPERHLHTLGWWRSVPRLREDLGGFSARFDAVDAWLALDVQGPELAPLSPASGGPAWYPRERRGLYFDRARHRAPQVVIPYLTTAALPRPEAVLDLP
ncbi:FtsK/SpoIIIE domain-containing protein [Glycomyces harbinensis]|uniref:FtsK/SpoIIIE family protein n=1 Tax=Glycomyces harbinensis TaxID=58114 RepID=A0A1G7CWV9_9ACTN|nr:FtsK/SpoIIIE domain-containing protein [Glycomyces harbinensis]SDE42975.1 FtsK/SpoIIIE family protein [Glycomyces harbinensis]